MILCKIWRHYHKLGNEGKPAPPLLIQTLAPTLPVMIGIYFLLVSWIFPGRQLLSLFSAAALIFGWFLLEVLVLILTWGKSPSR